MDERRRDRDDSHQSGRDPENDVLLVADDARTVGYLTMSVDPESLTEWHPRDATFAPRHGGHGLNTWLLQVGEARARAARRCCAGVRSREPARLTLVDEPGRGPSLRTARLHARQDLPRDADRARGSSRGTGRARRHRDPPLHPRSRRALAHATLAEAFEDHWGQAFALRSTSGSIASSTARVRLRPGTLVRRARAVRRSSGRSAAGNAHRDRPTPRASRCSACGGRGAVGASAALCC